METPSTTLASTWTNGVFVFGSRELTHELPGRSVRGLSHDNSRGAYAVVDGHGLYQRSPEGVWREIATSSSVLSVTYAIDESVFVGTDGDAQILRLTERGELEPMESFHSVQGRDSWFAGTFIVDGKEVGPPLGVRSLSGIEGGCLLANVHVGGIPRSADGGRTWAPTIEIDVDAHEVRASPFRRDLVVAATAVGLGISWDSGVSWTVSAEGLHAPYCSAVAITESEIFVAASESHFSEQGAIYRRPLSPSDAPMEKVASGLPEWLGGIVDTCCIASRQRELVIVTARGEVFGSSDAGESWQERDVTIPGVSSVLMV